MAHGHHERGRPRPVNPLADGGDHDRVVMLSLKADGTPDQHNPEIIGDKEFAIEAAKEQFAQQAVAAVDAVKRVSSGSAGTDRRDTRTPAIDALKAEHDKAAAPPRSAPRPSSTACTRADRTTSRTSPVATRASRTRSRLICRPL
jgi:hypothetical protein